MVYLLLAQSRDCHFNSRREMALSNKIGTTDFHRREHHVVLLSKEVLTDCLYFRGSVEFDPLAMPNFQRRLESQIWRD